MCCNIILVPTINSFHTYTSGVSMQLWVEFFEDLQNVRGRSRNTVMAYRRDLEVYEKFLAAKKPLSMLAGFLKSQGLSTRSQARVISSLRTYYKFLEDRGIDAPELRELRPPKVTKSIPRPLDFDEYRKLVDASKTSDLYKTARNHITLALLFGLGCRVSELIELSLQDVYLDDSKVLLKGKGGKQRFVPLTTFIIQELGIYLTHVRSHLTDDPIAQTSIIINDRGHRPSRVDIWRWLAHWSQVAGFDEPISPHRFRHGCATALLESGADLRSIQMILGHASLQTTQIYTTVATHKIQETVENHHPMSYKG
ncbi:MAG: integrase [Bdellovibrionales bacterium CG10_big_fil_rev_8_21_14_0_10_45_34]|nr:MAG: integrase [Bdellovibrionales bacterium CG10_big_fil_rev_8_21_14_0_10_45_34]